MKPVRLFGTGILFITGMCSLMLFSCSSTKETACMKYKRNTKYSGKPSVNLRLKPNMHAAGRSYTFSLNRQDDPEIKADGLPVMNVPYTSTSSGGPVAHPVMPDPFISQGISDRERRQLLASAELLNLQDAAMRRASEPASVRTELPGTNSMIAGNETVTRKGLRKYTRALKNAAKTEIKQAAPVYQNDDAATPAKGMAVASLVLGLVGLFVFGYVAGTLAIVFGAIALSRFKKNTGEKGMGMAVAGLILGILDVVLLAVLMAGM